MGYDRWETVTDARLPKAAWFFAEWHWWWFARVWEDRRLERRLRTPFFMSVRCANFAQIWVGPLTARWRMPWLRGPAEQHLKQFFGDNVKTEA